jgi:Tol biopolymer transport system component
MRSDGSDRRRITYSPDSGEVRSPDGRWIVHIRYLPEIYWPEIFVMDTSGGNLRRLTFIEGDKKNPKYSPDGSKIGRVVTYG